MASESTNKKKILANRLVQLIWEITNREETPYSVGYLSGTGAAIKIVCESDPEFAREYEKARKG